MKMIISIHLFLLQVDKRNRTKYESNHIAAATNNKNLKQSCGFVDRPA